MIPRRYVVRVSQNSLPSRLTPMLLRRPVIASCWLVSVLRRLGCRDDTCSTTHPHAHPQTHTHESYTHSDPSAGSKKGKGKSSSYSITERRVPELIPVLGSRPAGDVNHKLGGRLPLLSVRPAVTPRNP